jgi:hypothetical protein
MLLVTAQGARRSQKRAIEKKLDRWAIEQQKGIKQVQLEKKQIILSPDQEQPGELHKAQNQAQVTKACQRNATLFSQNGSGTKEP